MNAIPLAPVQRYFLEALGRNTRVGLPAVDLESAQSFMAQCWNSSGLSKGVAWEDVSTISSWTWLATDEALHRAHAKNTSAVVVAPMIVNQRTLPTQERREVLIETA